jgi:hypothetical protein
MDNSYGGGCDRLINGGGYLGMDGIEGGYGGGGR